MNHRHPFSAPPREIIYPTTGRPAQQALCNFVSRKGATIFKRSPRNQTAAPIANRPFKNLRALCVKKMEPWVEKEENGNWIRNSRHRYANYLVLCPLISAMALSGARDLAKATKGKKIKSSPAPLRLFPFAAFMKPWSRSSSTIMACLPTRVTRYILSCHPAWKPQATDIFRE